MPKQNKLKAILAEKQLTVHDFAISVEIKPSTFYKKLAGRGRNLSQNRLRGSERRRNRLRHYRAR